MTESRVETEKSSALPHKKITLITLVLLPLLILLGSWQLQRAAEKTELEAQWQQQQDQPVIALESNNLWQLPDYQRVMLTGHFSPQHQWLLDNRHRHGQYGLEVIQEFITEDGRHLLINRGWVAANSQRRDLPAVDTRTGTTTIFGELMTMTSHPLLEDTAPDSHWPRVILDMHAKSMGEAITQLLPERYIRLDDASEGALITEWQVTALSSAKHRGYAVQWFGLAMALLIWFVIVQTGFVRHRRSLHQSGEK